MSDSDMQIYLVNFAVQRKRGTGNLQYTNGLLCGLDGLTYRTRTYRIHAIQIVSEISLSCLFMFDMQIYLGFLGGYASDF